MHSIMYCFYFSHKSSEELSESLIDSYYYENLSFIIYKFGYNYSFFYYIASICALKYGLSYVAERSKK